MIPVCLSCIGNPMTADVLATPGSKASAAMVLNYLSWNILFSAPERLTIKPNSLTLTLQKRKTKSHATIRPSWLYQNIYVCSKSRLQGVYDEIEPFWWWCTGSYKLVEGRGLIPCTQCGWWHNIVFPLWLHNCSHIMRVHFKLSEYIWHVNHPTLLALNTLRPRQNGRHFADDMFKCIFLNENVWIPIEISLKFFPKGPINNIPALVQIMAWRRPGDKPLSEPMMVCLPTHICVIRPQWVNGALVDSAHKGPIMWNIDFSL